MLLDIIFSDKELNLLFGVINKIKGYAPINIKKISMKPNVVNVNDLKKYFSIHGGALQGHNVCSTPFNQIAISTSGDVYWHMRCYNDYVLGNIHSNSLNDIFYGNNASSFRTEFMDSNLCFDACTRCCGIIGADDVTRSL